MGWLKWLIIGLIVLVTVKSAIGQVQVNDVYDYIKLIENTDQCFDCYSIYEITSPYDNFVIDEQSFWFEFRNTADLTLRHVNQVNTISNMNVWIEESYQEPIYIRETTDNCIELQNDSKTCANYEEYNKLIDYETKTRWVQFKDTALNQGEKLRVKITGSIKNGNNVDNVMVIKINDKFEKLTNYAWWNSNWNHYVNVTYTDTQNLARTDEMIHIRLNGLSDLGNCTKEMRVINSTGSEITSQVINYGSNWCYVVHEANCSANGNVVYSYYYANPSANYPSYTDEVIVNQAGDDTITTNSAYDYVYQIDMDGGVGLSFTMSGTQILDESNLRLGVAWAQTTGAIFNAGETDDLCTLIYDGVVEVRYLCEAGEDSNKNGLVNAGESYQNYTFNPKTFKRTYVEGLNEEFQHILIDVDESVDGTVYYDGANQGVGVGHYYKVLSNGYLIVDMPVSDELVYLWNEDLGSGAENIDLYWGSGSSELTMKVGATAVDSSDFPPSTDVNFTYQLTGSAGGGLNTFGQNWEKRFDNPLENSKSQGAEQNVSVSYENYLEIFTTPVYELTNQTYMINMSWNTASISDVNMTAFEFNGTNYSVSMQNNGSAWENWTSNLIIPLQIYGNNTALPHKWYYTIEYVNTTQKNKSTTQNNTNVKHAYWISSLNNNGNITEGEYSIVNTTLTNITTSVLPSINVLIEWNGTNYTATQLSYTIYQLNQSTPNIVTAQNINQDSYLNLSYGSAFNIRNIAGITQWIFDIGIGNCSVYTTRAINFSIRDEDTDALVVSDVEGHFNVWVTGSNSSVYDEFNLTWTGASQYGICINPASANYTTNAQLIYEATGYDPKTYYLLNTILDNSTDLLTLYLTNNTTQVTLIVTDQNDDPVEDVYIYVQSYDIGTDSFTTTEIVKTDFRGQAYAQMILVTAWYKFQLIYEGAVVLDTSATKILTTTLTFRINTETDIFSNYNLANNVICSLTYNNATNNFQLSFNNPAATSVTATLNINKIDVYSTTLINTSSLTASSGTILLSISSPENKSYTATGIITIDSQDYVCGEPLSINIGGAWSQFGSEGVLMTTLLIIFMATVAVWSPTMALILCIIAVVGSVIMGFFHLGLVPLTVFIILGGISIYRLSRG